MLSPGAVLLALGRRPGFFTADAQTGGVFGAVAERVDALLQPVVARSVRRVLAVWLGVTAYTAAFALFWEWPTPIPVRWLVFATLLVAPLVGGGLIVGRASRPPVAALGVLLVAWGALDLFHSGPGVGCAQRLDALSVALVPNGGWPVLGVSTELPACRASWHWYEVELVPLLAGYGLLGYGA